MNGESPSIAWTPFFDGTSISNSASDLFWAKDHDSGTFDALDAQDMLITRNNHNSNNNPTSSSASTYSDSDIFPASSLHNLPAWSTAGRNDSIGSHVWHPASSKANGEGSLLVHSTSPGDAVSPSGISDGHGHGDGGLADDLWFIPSPESGAAPSTTAMLQRKKRMHFAKNLPSTMLNGEQQGANTATAAMLKSYKSTPNLARRISSDYSTRLEELLAEMGWPKQNGGGVGADQHGDADVAAAQDADVFGSSGGQSYDGNGARSTGSSVPTAGSLASGMPEHRTDSALYQRRASSREGPMPAPAPVAVPRKLPFEDAQPDISITAEQQESLQAAIASSSAAAAAMHASASMHSAHSTDTLGRLASAARVPLSQERSDALAAQQQRLQQMASFATTSVLPSGAGSHHGGTNSLPSTVKVGQASLGDESPLSTNQMLFPSSIGAIDTSPALGRPGSASSGSNTAELRTPITPFTNLQLSGAGTGNSFNARLHGSVGHLEQGQWYTPQMGGAMGTAPDFIDANFATADKMGKHVSSDGYLAGLQNSLGLYDAPKSANIGAPIAVNPSAVLDPVTFAQMFGNLPSAPGQPLKMPYQHIPQSQRLIFPPQQQKVVPVGMSSSVQRNGQRPRAGTAMAALGAPGSQNSPRHMRSTPNLQMMAQSSSHDGSHYGAAGASPAVPPVPSTPTKSVRKIASNRRLNMLAGAVTPETPSSHLAAMSIAAPSSPSSPTKRGRSGTLSASASMNNLGGSSAAFEFINYGINDADELCSAVAPSGSYKVPLKGFGENVDHDDEDDGRHAGMDDDEDEVEAADSGADYDYPRSPRRSGGSIARRGRSSTNRSGPRWEDPSAPPVPSLTASPVKGRLSSPLSNVDIAAAAAAAAAASAAAYEGDTTPPVRQVKRRKSDASMMLAGRRKSPSMSNLRKRD